MRTAWFFVALISSLVLAIAHTIASSEYLYWTYRWLDIPMHMLGAFSLASLLVAFLFRYKPVPFWVGVLIISIGWELFEFLIGAPRQADYMLDTVTDLINDGIGALVAFALARITIWRSV